MRESGLDQTTIVIFTSDNGPEHYAYRRDEVYQHWSAAPLRGLKRDIYEGGHRVPFLMRWPGKTAAGSVCQGLVSQIDLMATMAAMLRFPLPDEAAEDSHNLLPLITGETETSPRNTHVHNTQPNRYAIRQDHWVLVDGNNGYHSGGFQDWERRHAYPADDAQEYELYDLSQDLGQRQNLAAEQPEVVQQLRQRLSMIRGGEFTAPRLKNR